MERTSAIADGATVFVTGGSGFLGRRLVRDLRAQGLRVRALARSDRAAALLRDLGAEPVAGDLDDVAAMAAGMAGCTLVIHAAAKVGQWGAWEDFERVTVQGTKNVIAAARQAGVARLVHVSTEAVLAGGDAIVDADESTPYPAGASGYYPKSKRLAEQAALAANDKVLATVVVRPRFIWGRGDTVLLPRLAQAAKAGKWRWFGGGRHRMSTCHVANVSHGTLLAARFGRGGEVYFLTDGEPVEFRSFVTALMRSQGAEPGERTAPLWVADAIAAIGEPLWRMLRLDGAPPVTKAALNLFFREVTVSDAKARRELGYAPVISIEDGLRELQQG